MVRRYIYFKKTIEKEYNDKSKIQYIPEGKPKWKPGKRPEYMNILTRNQESIVIQARTRIMKFKENYKKDKGTSYGQKFSSGILF